MVDIAMAAVIVDDVDAADRDSRAVIGGRAQAYGARAFVTLMKTKVEQKEAPSSGVW